MPSESPIPQTQKALILPSNGGEFTVLERPVDVPGPGELLVKIHSAGLNPADWKLQRLAGAFVQEYPAVIGWDGAGEVVGFGEGSEEGEGRFKKGDRVFYQGVDLYAKYGSFQQYAVVRPEVVAKIPNKITYDEAATLPLVLFTAYGGMYHQNPYGLGLDKSSKTEKRYQGQPLVVIGGASAVGQMAIQLGRMAGFSPIITTASLKHTSYLLELGATHVIDRSLTQEAVTKEVKSILGGGKLKYVYDAIGDKETYELGLGLLDEDIEAQMFSVDPSVGSLEVKSGGKHVSTFLAILREAEGMADHKELFKEVYALVGEWLSSGDVKPTRFEVLPDGLEGIKRGIQRMEKGDVSGLKLIGHPQETK